MTSFSYLISFIHFIYFIYLSKDFNFLFVIFNQNNILFKHQFNLL